jgi:hypothetical protein
MELNLFVAQLAVISLPGLVWARLDARYASKVKPSEVEFFIRVFMFGLTSYAVAFLLYSALGLRFDLINFAEADDKSVISENFADEIVVAFLAGVILSLVWLYGTNRKWLARFLQFIGATNSYGDEDVWDFTFNSRSAQVEYIFFRDLDNKIVYSGWVKAFSETGKLRELVLRDVEVFNFDGEKMFETPLVYLARPPERMHIEFPYKP